MADIEPIGWTSLKAGRSQTTAAVHEGNTTPGAVINQYCIECHNDRTKSGDLSLSAFDPNNPGANPEVWEKVVRKLRGRMMPPGRRPDEKTYQKVVF